MSRAGPNLSQAPVFVAYYRVSTQGQGRDGYGIEAQRDQVARHAASVGGHVLGAYTEVESGKRNNRPELAKALAECRATGAVLIIAKLDRLARNARFLLSIVEGAGEAGVAFCDLPQLPPGPVGKFMVTMLAAVAELEAGMISQRTKAALEAAKGRGVKLGNPQLRAGTPEAAMRASAAASANARARTADVLPYVTAAQRAGATTLAQIAAALEARGVRTPRGSMRWAPAQVARLLKAA